MLAIEDVLLASLFFCLFLPELSDIHILWLTRNYYLQGVSNKTGD